MMKKRRPFNCTPFAELPRRQRRNLYVSLSWTITQEADKYGGEFTTHLMLDEPGRPKLYKQSFDVLFLGSDGLTISNATISTAIDAFWSKTSRLASERAFSLLSEEQQKQEGLEFEGPFRNEDGDTHYTMAERAEHAYECFGGLTLREYKEKAELEIIENEPTAIYQSFETDQSYEYGTGSLAIVRADEISREVIETTIDRFSQIGETDWQSEQPVPREVLPFENRETTLSKIEYSI
jgi:hypothetical protein